MAVLVIIPYSVRSLLLEVAAVLVGLQVLLLAAAMVALAAVEPTTLAGLMAEQVTRLVHRLRKAITVATELQRQILEAAVAVALVLLGQQEPRLEMAGMALHPAFPDLL